MKLKLVLICLLFSWYNIAWATLTAQIDPTTIQLGETFRLTLTSTDGQTSGVPDLTPLQRDFTIRSTERSTSYTMINGQARSMNQWGIILMPKHAGILLIPAIHWGAQASPSTQITVTENSEKSSLPSENALHAATLFSAKTKQQDVYVNQQIIYTVKLLNRQHLMDAEYHPPHIENALLVPLGEGIHSQTVLNGYTYEVDEQRYAIFPQKSGELTITPPSFSALAYGNESKRIHLLAKPVKLMVKPAQVSKNSQMDQWLPAQQVTLSEHYDNEALSFNEGDTFVRSITLKAIGLPAQLLPRLTFSHTDQFSVYPDKQTTDNQITQQTVIGIANVNVTYLLNKNGNVTIPPVQITWFNTLTKQNEHATLPARTILVKAKTVTPAIPVIKKTVASKSSVDVSKHRVISNNYITWLAVGLGCAWIFTLALWWFKPRAIRFSRNKNTILHALRDACMRNDRGDARMGVLRWAAVQWPHTGVLNLNDLMRLVHDPELKKQLHLLSLALYSQNNKIIWQGDALWRSVESYKPLKSKKSTVKNVLPPINPAE